MTPDGDPRPVYTIGHSTHSIEAFVALLRAGRVSMVIDVRKMPRSRTNPQYNLERLPLELAQYQIGHRYIAQLGGLRGKDTGIAPEVNALWRNRSFHNYADYALGPAFHEGLEELLALADAQACAIMCAEAVWWRCHRRIIADHLIAGGREVFHLMSPARVEPARLTEGARRSDSGLIYPAPRE